MNSKTNAIIDFMADEFRSFIYLLVTATRAFLGGLLVAFIPICALLVGFYNL